MGLPRVSVKDLGGQAPKAATRVPHYASVTLSRAGTHVYRRRHILVDPCSGDGETIAALSDIWFPDGPGAGHAVAAEIFGIELEAGRHQRLASRLAPLQHLHGDAFHFTIGGADEPGHGASCCLSR